MIYTFVPMTLQYAMEMKEWKYNGYVKNIYMKPYFESYDEKTSKMKGPGGCEGYAVVSEDKLVGLFEYYSIDDVMEIGLALSPEMVGKGHAKDFVRAGVDFGVKEFSYDKEYVKLSVNKNNFPAVKAYLNCDFIEHERSNEEIMMRKYL